MRSNLFWLNDEQWRKIAPLLPTDVRGKDRCKRRSNNPSLKRPDNLVAPE